MVLMCIDNDFAVLQFTSLPASQANSEKSMSSQASSKGKGKEKAVLELQPVRDSYPSGALNI
jgi:hypothetical protein